MTETTVRLACHNDIEQLVELRRDFTFEGSERPPDRASRVRGGFRKSFWSPVDDLDVIWRVVGVVAWVGTGEAAADIVAAVFPAAGDKAEARVGEGAAGAVLGPPGDVMQEPRKYKVHVNA